jgi:predicted kinase
MIKLIDILREAQEVNKPKAIFLTGPAGAGKTFISKQLPLGQFEVINVDDTYEEMLKASGIGMNQKDFGPEELSKAAQLMAQARKTTQSKYDIATEDLHDIIIDSPGGAINPVLKKKKQLEDLGYETMMLMVYVSPMTSLEQNTKRERSLIPTIVLRTWKSVNQNVNDFKNAFGDNFIIVNNDREDADTSFDPAEVKRKYFDTAKFRGKEKTPEEQAKSRAEAEQLNKDIAELIKKQPDFTSLPDAKSKIQTFIK